MVHYKDNLRVAIETAKPLVDEAMQSYDEMIRQIQESEGWRNRLVTTACKHKRRGAFQQRACRLLAFFASLGLAHFCHGKEEEISVFFVHAGEALLQLP